MAYSIEYEKVNARYVVSSGLDTILIIKPYEKDKSWIGVEYTEDVELKAEYYDFKKCKTTNDVIDEVDAAILFKTKDLPEMLRELAKFIEEGKHGKLIRVDK